MLDSLAARQTSPPAPFHRRLQEETLAKLRAYALDYYRCEDDDAILPQRVEECRRAIQTQAKVIAECAALCQRDSEEAQANQATISRAAPTTLQSLADSQELWNRLRTFERQVIVPPWYHERDEEETAGEWAAEWPDAVIYTAIGPNTAQGEHALDVQAGDLILMTYRDKGWKDTRAAYHLTPRNKASLSHGLVTRRGCLVEATPETDSSSATEEADASRPPSDFSPSTSRFVDATDRYVAFRQALQDIVAVAAARAIKSINDIIRRTDEIMDALGRHLDEETRQLSIFGDLKSMCARLVDEAENATEELACREPLYFDEILWLTILSRAPA
ncbi:hypothetical protein JCM10908_000557 [Rhodotorula pacifica]|uniref:uncharacterized protein n=1 Tax=Rhodotorula pacifica TaxID=1495444 RepID=UPI00316FE424